MDARGFIVLVGIWELKEDDSDAPTDVHVANDMATVRATAKAPRSETLEMLSTIFTEPFVAVVHDFNRKAQSIRYIHSTNAWPPFDSASTTSSPNSKHPVTATYSSHLLGYVGGTLSKVSDVHNRTNFLNVIRVKDQIADLNRSASCEVAAEPIRLALVVHV